jgi:hypothetical protein
MSLERQLNALLGVLHLLDFVVPLQPKPGFLPIFCNTERYFNNK